MWSADPQKRQYGSHGKEFDADEVETITELITENSVRTSGKIQRSNGFARGTCGENRLGTGQGDQRKHDQYQNEIRPYPFHPAASMEGCTLLSLIHQVINTGISTTKTRTAQLLQ